jgi:hypothetical protein
MVTSTATATTGGTSGSAAATAAAAAAVACMGSSKTGQGALQGLPTKSQTSKRNHIRNYALPENAIEKVLSSPAGSASASTKITGSFARRRNSSSSNNTSGVKGGGGGGNKEGIAVWKVNKVGCSTVVLFYSRC